MSLASAPTALPGTAVPLAENPPRAKRFGSRIDAIDILRGLVIVVMALDHVKGNISCDTFDFVNLTRTTEVHFLTRWITHFCAPVFMFLAGTAAFLYGQRGKTKGELAWFLLSRGLWLVFLELTVIRFSWLLNFDYSFSFGGVLWAIGWAMIALAGLVYLPLSAITVFGVATIAFHNLFDAVRADQWGDGWWAWCILHTGDRFELYPGIVFHPFYPLVPWIGVMAVGYAFGAMMLLDRERRRMEVMGLGIMLTLLFVALRWSNVYGDKISTQAGHPGPWSPQEDLLFTLFSFVNCQKYPPSLDFLLMTLGPALVLLALLDRGNREPGRLGRFFLVYGRVPMFFYLLHWFLLKAIVFGFSSWHHGRVDWLFAASDRADYGCPLWGVYVVWIGVVLFFYPLCLWYAAVKSRSQSVWLSYL